MLGKGGKVGAIRVEEKEFTRSELDGWVKKAQDLGSKGLLYVRWSKEGALESPVAKFLPADFFAPVSQKRPSRFFCCVSFYGLGYMQYFRIAILGYVILELPFYWGTSGLQAI